MSATATFLLRLHHPAHSAAWRTQNAASDAVGELRGMAGSISAHRQRGDVGPDGLHHDPTLFRKHLHLLGGEVRGGGNLLRGFAELALRWSHVDRHPGRIQITRRFGTAASAATPPGWGCMSAASATS
jgi:hypothetical protein